MRKFDKSVIVLFVMLLLVGGFFVAVIYKSSAQAVETHAQEQFKVSPHDVTNTRVLVEQRRTQAKEIVSAFLLRQFENINASFEGKQETEYEPEYAEYYYVSNAQDYASSEDTRYTEYYPSENTGAFAYAPDLEITLGADGTYRDKDGFVVVAGNRNEYSPYEEVDTPYGKGKVYDTGCSYGIVDVYREG